MAMKRNGQVKFDDVKTAQDFYSFVDDVLSDNAEKLEPISHDYRFSSDKTYVVLADSPNAERYGATIRITERKNRFRKFKREFAKNADFDVDFNSIPNGIANASYDRLNEYVDAFKKQGYKDVSSLEDAFPMKRFFDALKKPGYKDVRVAGESDPFGVTKGLNATIWGNTTKDEIYNTYMLAKKLVEKNGTYDVALTAKDGKKTAYKSIPLFNVSAEEIFRGAVSPDDNFYRNGGLISYQVIAKPGEKKTVKEIQKTLKRKAKQLGGKYVK